MGREDQELREGVPDPGSPTPGSPSPAGWLTVGSSNRQAVSVQGALVTACLEDALERSLMTQALDDRRSVPRVYVTAGTDIAPLIHNTSLIHYDLTGHCRNPHPHVVWDPARANFDETWTAAGQLLLEDWKAAAVAHVALWSAGSSGYGVKTAMDWLAAGELPAALAHCRQLARQIEREPPLFDLVDKVLTDLISEQQAIVYKARQALAPVEEAIRTAADAGQQTSRLDVTAWVEGGGLLLVTLPPNASLPQRQMIAALLWTANRPGMARYEEFTAVWYHVDTPPHKWDWNFGHPWLVVTRDGPQFTAWIAGQDQRQGGALPSWLVGPVTDRKLRGAFVERFGSMWVEPIPHGGPRLVSWRPTTHFYDLGEWKTKGGGPPTMTDLDAVPGRATLPKPVRTGPRLRRAVAVMRFLFGRQRGRAESEAGAAAVLASSFSPELEVVRLHDRSSLFLFGVPRGWRDLEEHELKSLGPEAVTGVMTDIPRQVTAITVFGPYDTQLPPLSGHHGQAFLMKHAQEFAQKRAKEPRAGGVGPVLLGTSQKGVLAGDPALIIRLRQVAKFGDSQDWWLDTEVWTVHGGHPYLIQMGGPESDAAAYRADFNTVLGTWQWRS